MPYAHLLVGVVISALFAVILFIFGGSQVKNEPGLTILTAFIGLMFLFVALGLSGDAGGGSPTPFDVYVGVPYCTEWHTGEGTGQRYLLKNTENGREYFMNGDVSLPGDCFIKTRDGKYLTVPTPPGSSVPAPPTPAN